MALVTLGAGACRSAPARPAPEVPRVAASASSAIPSGSPGEAHAASTFSALRDAYIAAWLEAEPASGRELGLHEYDGKIADRSARAIAARIEYLTRAVREFAAVDARALSEDDALDLALLRRSASLKLFWLTDLAEWQTRPQFYEELFAVNAYLDRDYAPLEQRAQKLLEHERAALERVDQIRQNLRSPLARPIVEVAIKIYAGYAQYLRGEVAQKLAAISDANFQAQFQRVNRALAERAEALADSLRRQDLPRADDSHVLGAERYEKLLKLQEALPFDAAELKRRGELDRAANRVAYDALVKTTRITRPAANRLLSEAERIVDRAHAFVSARRLVTLPGDDTALVRETPPFMRYNQAFLNGPGPFDTATAAYFYITLPNPAWPKAEQRAYVMSYGNLLGTAIHEVYPGHFVQGQWLRRAPTRVQKMFDSYSFAEGWAHYAEQMIIDEGLGKDDPQNRLGQLSGALLRDCRVLASIGIHTEGMTVEAAAHLFANECLQDPASAREQAVRGTFDPGYFAYTLGKLQILELRREAELRLGARFDLRRFHDALLAHGAPPVPLIRERVLAELDAASAE